MWHDSTNSHAFRSVGALTDCSIILYVMAERWPTGRKYRDLFESVKKSVVDAIGEGKHMPRIPVTAMTDDTKTTLLDFQDNPTTDSIYEDLEHMICDMTGQPDFWESFDMNTGMSIEMDNDAIFSIPINVSEMALPNSEWEPF
jgi:hypothetical protein